MNHTAFFGDGEKNFALTDEMIHELERKTGVGILALHTRFRAMAAHFSDLIEVIRTGLIGAGTSPEEAHKLVSIYSRSMLITDLYLLAFDVFDARFSGKPEQAAAPGDMSAAINLSLAESGL
jgi:hypothetical protein